MAIDELKLRELDVKILSQRAAALEEEAALTRALLREAQKQAESRKRTANAVRAIAAAEADQDGEDE